MDVTLLYFDDCPNWRTTEEHLRALAEDLDLRINRHAIETPEEAVAQGFHGSPTVLIDGRDPFLAGNEPVGLSCRIYQTPEGPAGSPTREQLRQVLTEP